MSIRAVATMAAAVWLLAAPGGGVSFAATLNVHAGGNLQAALNAAQPGDVIVLAAGATLTRHVVLPVEDGAELITLR